MSTWHPVAVNITTNQIQCLRSGREAAKKKGMQVQESNQQSRGKWIRKKIKNTRDHQAKLAVLAMCGGTLCSNLNS